MNSILLEVFAISLCVFAYLGIGRLLCHYTLDPPVNARHSHVNQLDGLRAVLAIGVFIHHFFCISNFVRYGDMHRNMSTLAQTLGTWSVSMFFTITSYLFCQRLLDIRSGANFVGLQFIIGRIFRIVPVAILAGFLFLSCNFRVYIDVTDLNRLSSNWLELLNTMSGSFYKVASGPKSNYLEEYSWLIQGNAQWTLHYEWVFYLCIVVLSVIRLSARNVIMPILATVGLCCFMENTSTILLSVDPMWSFIPGIIVGIFDKQVRSSKFLSSKLGGIIAIFLVFSSTFIVEIKYKIPIQSLFLAIIVCGNPITHFLQSNIMRSLGSLTYSIYMLHGSVQYIWIRWIVTVPSASQMSIGAWWAAASLQVIFTVFLAFWSHRLIEIPCMQFGSRVSRQLYSLIERKQRWLVEWI